MKKNVHVFVVRFLEVFSAMLSGSEFLEFQHCLKCSN